MSGKALLIDVDSTIPNLALMHISTWRKSEGMETGFHITDPDEVWASCIFHKNAHMLDGLSYFYPNARRDIGGGGIDLHKTLPEGVDELMPDYSLYPDWDSDLGFTSRGCNRSCHFCVVPKKEGRFRINQHPSEFHDPGHRSVTLLDNNILWDKDWFFEVTDWIIKNRMKVDFNQGLDIRLVDRDIAKRIAELKPIKFWHFAFDSLDYKDAVIDGIRMLNDAGVNVRSKSNWYVYLHDDSQYESALERCNILRDLNALPYIMVNRDAPRTLRMTDLKRWTRPQFFFTMPFEAYVPNRRQHRMDKPAKCPTCGSAPEPVKRERSELYVCECDCGWTCLGHDPEQAVRSWNQIMASETPYGNPKKKNNNRSERTCLSM